jgi:hypothetical protein
MTEAFSIEGMPDEEGNPAWAVVGSRILSISWLAIRVTHL